MLGSIIGAAIGFLVGSIIGILLLFLAGQKLFLLTPVLALGGAVLGGQDF